MPRGDKTVKLAADVVYGLKKSITVEGNKTLELDGHKIILITSDSYFELFAGASLKVDGKENGSEIKSTAAMIFSMNGGSLTIDGGRYIVPGAGMSVVCIYSGTSGGKIKINDGYFQSTKYNVIYSASRENENPPEVVINGGTFVGEGGGWISPDYDVTKGTVNSGTFYSSSGGYAFSFFDTGNKHLGAGKFLVMDGVYKDNPILWQLEGMFIQVGNLEDDLVEVQMNAADCGKGYFFKKSCAQNTVLAMKHSILPVVAVPDEGNILSSWEKVAGEGRFEDETLMDAYYIPQNDSWLKPNFATAPLKPTLETTQIGRASCRERV